jgi:hypothetical protein
MANRRPHVLVLALALGAVMLLSSVQEATAIACSPYGETSPNNQGASLSPDDLLGHMEGHHHICTNHDS